MKLLTDRSIESDDISCDDDSSWVYESESSDGSRALNFDYVHRKKNHVTYLDSECSTLQVVAPALTLCYKGLDVNRELQQHNHHEILFDSHTTEANAHVVILVREQLLQWLTMPVKKKRQIQWKHIIAVATRVLWRNLLQFKSLQHFWIHQRYFELIYALK